MAINGRTNGDRSGPSTCRPIAPPFTISVAFIGGLAASWFVPLSDLASWVKIIPVKSRGGVNVRGVRACVRVCVCACVYVCECIGGGQHGLPDVQQLIRRANSLQSLLPLLSWYFEPLRRL